MELKGSVLKCFVVLLFVASIAATCPHQTAGLLRWSSTATWPTGQLPVAGSNVVITSGRQVLLDISPPALASVTIQNGSLVWNNQTGLELRSGYVLVNAAGSFIVGSEDCPFTLKATISLTGTVASPNVTGFGSKFLGVAANGTLELHGKLNGPAWTRLTARAYPPISTKFPGGRGMNVVVFDQNTGAFLERGSFDTFLNTSNSEAFAAFVKAVPTGRIVVINVQDEAFEHLTEDGYEACESVGSALIRQLQYRSGWAIIGVKGGAKGCCPEDIKTELQRPTALLTKTFTSPSPIYPLYPTLEVYVQSEANYSFLLNSSYAGNPVITTLDNTVRDGWAPGTQVIVTTTDSHYDHTELNTVVACPTCAANQVKLANPFVYTHWGQVESGVEMRAEVASLTRNILIQGIMANANDSHGANTKFVKGFKNVHIDGVEYTNVGQHHEIGHYPVHWHMAGDLDAVGGYTEPTYLKNSAIHHSFARCFSIHGSHGVYVYNNVGYDIMGHCFFLEDGIETRNTLDHNLGALTNYGYLLLSDMSQAYCSSIGVVDPTTCAGVSTFWLTNPNNTITNNVAAGSVQKGIWYILPVHPTGLSASMGANVWPQYTPMGTVSGNMAHSTAACFRLDDGIVYNPNNTLLDGGIGSSRYKPHVGSNLSNPRVNANINSLSTHHCTNGAWLRGGQITLNNYASADNIIGVTFASEGTNPNDPGSWQTLNGGLFVGVSENSDWSPTYNYPIIGYQFYDGPHNKTNLVFKNFTSNAYHKVACFGTELNNLWQLAPTSNTSGLQFDNSSLRAYFGNGGQYYGNNDGMHNSIMHDSDGSLTRLGPGTWAVSALPVHTLNSCQYQPAWNASVCPNTVRYGQLFFHNNNQTGTNFGCTVGNPSCVSGFTLIRDDKSSNPLPMVGIPNTPPPNLQFQPLIMLNKTYTAHFPHPSPPNFQMQITNWLVGEHIRLGICYPPLSTFNVTYQVGSLKRALTPVSTLAALDASTNNTVYYYDSAVNLLFVKPTSLVPRDGLNYCSISGCEYIVIAAHGPNIGNMAYKGVCPGTYPKYATTDTTTAVPPSTYST